MKSLSENIQMKATEQYFPVFLSIMLYKVVLAFESISVEIQLKATEQYVPVVSLILLYKAFLDSEFVVKILKYNHSNESYAEHWSCLFFNYFPKRNRKKTLIL